MVHDVHSIYFEIMGEHGFIGFGMFMLLALFTWRRANQVIRVCKDDPTRKWAADLAAMIQVSLVGYGAGGAFLGLAYFDLTYHLMIILLLAQFSGTGGTSATIRAESAGRWPQPRPRMRLNSMTPLVGRWGWRAGVFRGERLGGWGGGTQHATGGL
jgi:hypothetical protein